jgi:hypothetical protein
MTQSVARVLEFECRNEAAAEPVRCRGRGASLGLSVRSAATDGREDAYALYVDRDAGHEKLTSGLIQAIRRTIDGRKHRMGLFVR